LSVVTSRAQPIRIFWADRRFLFFIPNNQYFCITQTIVERYYFTAMKNHTTSISMQIWVTKAVSHHRTYPDLFADSHLHTAQKPAIEC